MQAHIVMTVLISSCQQSTIQSIISVKCRLYSCSKTLGFGCTVVLVVKQLYMDKKRINYFTLAQNPIFFYWQKYRNKINSNENHQLLNLKRKKLVKQIANNLTAEWYNYQILTETVIALLL